MRIDHIHIQNFRGIENLELTFQPGFNLLVGDNGSGKTSILSAVAVGLGIWHVCGIEQGAKAWGNKQWRSIADFDVREVLGEGRQFEVAGEVQITTTGSIGMRTSCTWTRRKRAKGARTVDANATEVTKNIANAMTSREQQTEALPLLAYYGAGRAWLPSNERETADLKGDLKARRADGYYDCLNERIRLKDILKWFVLEAASRDEKGLFKPAFEAVRLALKRGIPGVEEIYWDHQKAEIVAVIRGVAQPFSCLSDGQRTMAATIADMAIRATTLNGYLLEGNGSPERLLNETPGVVLIDELDVHLHPDWQRTVINELGAVFPSVQFICSSHSPQLFGELRKENIWLYHQASGKWRHPRHSFGLDSARILEEEMDVFPANPEVIRLKSELGEVIDREEFPLAEKLLRDLAQTVGEDDPDITRARTLMAFLKETE